MRNNKNVALSEIKKGLRIKMALPTTYAIHNHKELNKKYSWWKGKVVDVRPNGSFTVYINAFLGRIFVPKNKTYRIVKVL